MPVRPAAWVSGFLAFGFAAGVLLHDVRTADACGCLSPPAVTEGDYAVNQEAEQIIFEVQPGWVIAHVLIKYAGDPKKFAWIVPVPEVPTLAISPVSAFGLLDRATAPDVAVTDEDLCPISEWSCQFHDPVSCGDDDSDWGGGIADAGASSSDGGTGGKPPVTVIDEKVVGDYETVTFRASEAAAAVKWLRDNGFIVNPTTSIYMEPYVQANMVFVAAKLVPGAGVKSIKPLRMKYRAAYPMVPLVLTAVAAQPHLTMTAYVYANQPFRPLGHPVVTIDPARIAHDREGRLNYPMVLARTIDEAGGDGFAIEYRDLPVRPEFGQGTMCCGQGYDTCFLGGNGTCECPRDDFDQADCKASGDLLPGLALVDRLAGKYTSLTRITTRVSPEEMRFDPQFEPDFNAPPIGRMTVHGTQASLAGCTAQIIDENAFTEIAAEEACAAMYCGQGRCVTTQHGGACACDAGYVAQRFDDLDGKPSVTCVPEVPTVDLRAGGFQLPDACANVSCGEGRCIDRNGIAVCDCDSGAGAVVGAGATPVCEPIVTLTQSPGADNFSEPLRTLDVCAPPPPACGSGGWLVKTGGPRPGVDCGNTAPPEHLTIPPPKPTCDSFLGCGCQGTPDAAPAAALLGALGFAYVVLVGRRRRGARG
ncbi:MAG TPA: DUF2330 domain-containing protein [Kofleriaceae bacterium]|nr:DUF2330 domain-containing protein [Kofleriaceae bacterium]